MGTQGAGRKRSTKKDKSTAEDDALNLIAREAEARLAAKRAARAEAREIRMKELERQQKELSDDDERMSVGSRSSVRDSSSLTKSKKKKKHKHKDRDRNGPDDDHSLLSSRSSRLSDESRVSRSSRLDLTSSRLSDDPRGSRGSRLDLQPTSYSSSDLYSYNGLSSARNPGSTYNGYQPVEYSSCRSSGSRVSSRAGSARTSPVDHCGSVASYLRSAAGGSGLPRDLDDVTIPDLSDVRGFAPAGGRRRDVEDRDYLEKGSRAASALTAATLTSLGGTSSRRGSGETAITVDAETSIREIKDALVGVEEKYRKAMVSNAQLDNEKNNLMYQVDTLKDSLMELEELLSESRRGFEDKVKECEREKHAHTVLQFQFNEMKETLKQSEELLNDIRQLHIKQEGLNREICDLQETVEWKDKKIGALERQKEYTDAIRMERDELREEVVNLKDILKKHGIVLGPDLSINGEVGETEADGTPGADPASPLAQDLQTPLTEGNSMLGNTEETLLRSSEEEEVDPEQQQEHFEEAKENLFSSEALCNVSGVCTTEASEEEQPTRGQQNATEEDGVEEPGLRKDLNVDMNDQSVTESKDIIICSPELQGIVTSSEESVTETVMPEGKELGWTNNLDSGETGSQINSVDTQSDDIREEDHLRNTESCPEQEVGTESLPEKSVPAESKTEAQPEPENSEEAEHMETEEISGNAQPQGAAAAPGKKKKRKRKGKKKGGTQEDGNQQRDGANKEKGKTEVKIELATKDNELTAEPEILSSVAEALEEPGMHQVKNVQDRHTVEEVEPIETLSPNDSQRDSRRDHVTDERDKEHTLEMEKVEEAEATTETCSHVTTPAEVRLDHVKDEQNKEQCLETVKAAEAVAPAETFSHLETLKESRTDPISKDEQEQPLETQRVEEVGSVPETNLSTESPDDLNKECTSCLDASKSDISTNDSVIQAESEMINSAENRVRPIDEMKSECTPNIPENTFESIVKENAEAGSQNPINGDMAAEESKPTSKAESNDKTSVSPSSTNGFTDSLRSSSGFELSAGVNSASVDKVSDGGPGDVIETSKDDEDPGIQTEQDKPQASPSVLFPSNDEAELTADTTEKEELNRGLSESEGLVQTDLLHDQKKESLNSPSFVTNMDVINTVQSLLETVVQAEQLDDVEIQTAQCEVHVDKSNADLTPESEIHTTETVNAPDFPKEAPEHGSTMEQDHRSEEFTMAEDPEHNNNPNDQQSETQQLHEPMEDIPSQLTLQVCDEEDGEGHSFDFDDMDLEPAEGESLPRNPQPEEVEEGVEVVPDEVGSSGVQTPPQNCSAQEDGALEKGEYLLEKGEYLLEKGEYLLEKEEVGVANEPRGIAEEAKVQSVGEVGGVAEDVHRAVSLPVEEGLEAIEQVQGEHEDLPKSSEQVGSNTEPQQAGKDVRKNSKKGKGKGKEECKMS
ncbi:A-kinase anchor protein 12 isoform X3 [Trematomus bernacchii]|uniref:A-kinase anchor protein 12 isoform X3 n=1 Tax=Trematomus bernacchii TaxID=40690 RepID=UPI00146A64C8|nr:A-kinase anchor protein 12 isoform X3 [Trematomus bernacchii]